jgi:predicted porin
VRFGTAMTQFNRHSNASPGNLTSGAVDSTSWGFSSPFVVNSAGSGVEQQRILGVGGGYDFGLVNLTANYTNVLYNYTDTTGLRLQNAEVAASVRITPAWLIGATYIYTWGQYSTDKKPAWHQIDLGTLYSLSKRTDVFVTMIYQKAVGDAPFAEIYSLSKANGKSQAMVQLGMRHRF